jgi:HAMP domain-containing protein
VNQTLRIPALLALIVLLALGMSSCGQDGNTDAGTNGAPLNETDRALNDYEKDTNELARLVRKLQGGDLRVTVPVIQMRHQIKESAAKLQQQSPRMTPAQAQRAAAIAAKAAPYLNP